MDRPLLLIIDDHVPFREMLRRFLEASGFAVLGASSAAEGLALAARQHPELIILDLLLESGGKSGEQTLRELKGREDTRSIPVIAISGVFDGLSDEMNIRYAGADSFLPKSQIVEQELHPLLRQIQALLRRRTAPKNSKTIPGPGLVFTILVIDDEEDTVERLRILFKDQPYEFLWASSGRQGVFLVEHEVPDLVILDLNMPGMSGEDVCRRLREQQKWFRMPILMLTGDSGVLKEAQCIDMGADDFLAKTDPPLRLQARIRGLLRRGRFGANARGISSGGVFLDFLGRRLVISGNTTLELSGAEMALVIYLMSASGKVLDEEVLFKKLSRAWPQEELSRIKEHVAALRRKLDAFGGLIQAVEQGYRFNLEYAKRIKS